MNELAGKYEGMDRFAARKAIVKDLEEAGLLVKIEKHLHSVGHSERTDVVVEPRLSKQWFVKMGGGDLWQNKPSMRNVKKATTTVNFLSTTFQ